MASKKLGVNNRKAIFLKLVELQDSGITVRDSKNQIQESFGIEDDELQRLKTKVLITNGRLWVLRKSLSWRKHADIGFKF